MNKHDTVGISRRDLMKFGAVATVAASAAAYGQVEESERADASRPNTRFLVDVHVHAGATPGMQEIGKEVNSPSEWGATRTKDPERFGKAMAQEQTDNSDALIKTMDEHGVTHAVLQTAPGVGATNERIADMVRRHPGRFFPVYRPESLMAAAGAGDLMRNPDEAVFARNAQRFVEDVESLFPELGLIGVGEVIPGGLVTSAVDPVEIARAMSPIMEALSPGNLPIQFPTGYTGWKGGLHYIWEPIWIDELAANFPDVPIVLVKMGRGFRTSFDTCMVIAVRNANVYLEITDAPSEHVREAVHKIGAERIMFGTDLSAISLNYSYDLGFRDLNGAKLNAEEVEWIAWRTANKVYQLGLGG